MAGKRGIGTIFLLTLFLSCAKDKEPPAITTDTATPPLRIISLAPTITETLYDLGLGAGIVGVTKFCDYPPQASSKAKVGGYADFNYEMILRLKPELAVILKEQRDMAAFFDRYKIRYAAVGSDSVEEILESVRIIAGACSVAARGDSLISVLRGHIERPFSEPASTESAKNRPKVLLCVSRDNAGSGAIGNIFAAGASSFYNELIELAGGVNVLGNVTQGYASIGAEAVVRLNPAIIIDLSLAYSGHAQQAACGDWKAFKTVSAVKFQSVYCLTGAHLTRPGPRFWQILDDFRGVIR